MSRFLLALLRLCLGAWVGTGCFFVAVIIALRRSELFEESAKLNHAKVLFPLYYWFLFSLLTTALVAGVLSCRLWKGRRSSETDASRLESSGPDGITAWPLGLAGAVLILS